MRKLSLREELGWAIHNIIGHPISGVFYLLALVTPGDWFFRAGAWAHDVTIPKSRLKEARHAQ